MYVKALCDAETATPLADRKIKYSFFLDASAMTPLQVAYISNGRQNFNTPTLNIPYPASAVVPIGASNTRTFTVIQTRNYSHVNYLQVTVQCDPDGLDISKVEVRRNDGKPWTEVTVETTPTGYRYIIKLDEVFSMWSMLILLGELTSVQSVPRLYIMRTNCHYERVLRRQLAE